MEYFNHLKISIGEEIKKEKDKFVIFPFGERGMLVKQILNEMYGIQEEYIIDNYLCNLNKNIKPLSFLSRIKCSQYTFLITSDNLEIYDELRKQIKEYVPVQNIVDFIEKHYKE